MKWKKFEKCQDFENLTKFTKVFRCSHCWIIRIDQCKLTIFKEKNRIEFQKNFNFLHLCDFCIAAYDKNKNKSNYEAHQTLFIVSKMNVIESLLQKILYVEIFRTSNSTKWNVLDLFSSHLNSSSHTSTHNTMRHRRFFEIFKSKCKSAFALQLKSILINFKNWVQKLLKCEKYWIFFKIYLTLKSTFESSFFAISTRIKTTIF